MSSIISKTGSLHHLQTLFPHAVAIDAASLATALGFSAKTVDNQGKRFPIPCIRLGRNKRYRLVDIAAFMDAALGLTDESTATAETSAPARVKRSRGRPPKIARRPS